MEVDLTQDSDPDDSLDIGHFPLNTSSEKSQQLLQLFQNRKPKPANPAVRPKSGLVSRDPNNNTEAKGTGVTAEDHDTPSTVSRKRSRRSSQSSTGPAAQAGIASRKSSLSSALDANADHPPGHHGLSPFFDVSEQTKPRGGYKHVREVNRDDVELRRSSRTFTPLRNDHERVRNWRKIYSKKLRVIDGPRVKFRAKNAVRKVEFNFEFINKYKLQEGVERVDPNFQAGCGCKEQCNPLSCTCLSQEVDSEKRIVPYQAGPNGMIVLRQDFMKRGAVMIYECSSLCGCAEDCWNRVVSNGRTVRLEIFETENRGLGLRSPDRIHAGQFIDCYLGEIITKRMADDREGAMGDAAGDAASYLFSLDFFSEDDDVYVVDGRRYGSVTRFMNHSCDPNCKMFSVSHNHADEKIFDMAFFALKDIAPYTELTFDYDPSRGQNEQTEVDPDAVKCLCGAKNCRGQLWPNQRKTMQYDSDSE